MTWTFAVSCMMMVRPVARHTNMHRHAVVLLVFAALRLTSGFTWNPAFPDGTRLEVCDGDRVVFDWKITLDESEFLSVARWSRTLTYDQDHSPGKHITSDQIVFSDNDRFEYVRTGRLTINRAKGNDTGLYVYVASIMATGEQETKNYDIKSTLRVQVPPETVDNRLNVVWEREATFRGGHWTLTLQCGIFKTRGQPAVEVLWKTPSNVVVTSTSYDDALGYFTLVLPYQFHGGEYSCIIPIDSIYRRCSPHNATLVWEASVMVDEAIGRQLILDARMQKMDSTMQGSLSQLEIRTMGRTIKGVRLVNGSSAKMGRVEVLHDMKWGTVCDDSWDENDAKVICRMLGYSGGMPYYNATFGSGEGSIVLGEVACAGDEAHIDTCPSVKIGLDAVCQHQEDAGVACD